MYMPINLEQISKIRGLSLDELRVRSRQGAARLSDRFRRATSDRFIVVIEADDPKFDEVRTTAFLKGLGATAVEKVEE